MKSNVEIADLISSLIIRIGEDIKRQTASEGRTRSIEAAERRLVRALDLPEGTILDPYNSEYRTQFGSEEDDKEE